jgi:ADP-heptose:LPS heptosyltransferase
MKIYASVAGGLGDFILQILGGSDVPYFRDLKQRHPEADTCVHAWYVTDSSRDLLIANPDIDQVIFNDFDRLWESRSVEIAQDAGYRRFTDEERCLLTRAKPTWTLNQLEREYATNVLAGPPFVAFHPFAGTLDRDFRANGVEPEAAAAAMCEAGVRVVLLGGNSKRQTHDGHEDLADAFGYAHENLVDMRDQPQVTCRLHAFLVSRARAFIGTTSAYNCAAEMYAVPTLAFTADFIRRHVERDMGGIFWMMRERGTRVEYFDRLPADPCGLIAEFAKERIG